MSHHEKANRRKQKAKAEQDAKDAIAKAEEEANLKKQQEEKAEQDRTKAEQDAKAEEAKAEEARANRAKAEQDAKLKKEQEAKAEQDKTKAEQDAKLKKEPQSSNSTYRTDDSKDILETIMRYFDSLQDYQIFLSQRDKKGEIRYAKTENEICKLKGIDPSLCEKIYEQFVEKQRCAGEEKLPGCSEHFD